MMTQKQSISLMLFWFAILLLVHCPWDADRMCVAATPPSSDAGDSVVSPKGSRRWAVLASPSIRKQGLSDLLSAELASRDGFMLVEREQIDKVLEEQVLSELLSGDSVRQRHRLGGLLKADCLLILEGNLDRLKNNSARIHLAIVDTQIGADLYSAKLEYQKGEGDILVSRIAKMADNMRKRFAHGVKAVVGIPPFLSNSVFADYNHLQKAYADLLAATLMGKSGIAVVSIDQARHIRWEHDLTGGQVDGVTSLFVFGKFRVIKAQTGKSPQADLQISIQDGNKPLDTLRYENLPFDQVPATLVGQVATTIVRLSGSGPARPTGLQEQAALFGRRADELKTVGAIEESLGLRESILLLAPDNVPQRYAIVFDYLRSSARRDRDCLRMAKSYREAMRHAEYLLRNRLATLPQGLQLVRMLSSHGFRDPFWGHSNTGEYYSPATRNRHLWAVSMHPFLIQLPPEKNPKVVEEQLLVGPYPLVHRKPNGRANWDAQRQYQFLADYLFNEFVRRWQTQPSDLFFRGIYDELASLLQEAPDEFLATIEKTGMRPTKLGMYDREQYEEFWERLLASDRPAVRRYAKAATTSVNARMPHYLTRSYGPRTAARKSKQYRALNNPILRVEPDTPVNTQFSLVKIPGWHYPTTSIHPWERSSSPKIHSLKFVSLGWPEPFVRLEKLNKSTDLAWDQENVFFVSRNEVGQISFKRIFSCQFDKKQPEVDAVLRVRSDGKNVWVATIKDGVSLFSHEGKRLAHVDVEAGLPLYQTAKNIAISKIGSKKRPQPSMYQTQKRLGGFWHEFGPGGRKWEYSTSIKGVLGCFQLSLMPISEGRCLAYGRSGKAAATWIALLSHDGHSENIDVKLLYSADQPLPPLLDKPIEQIEAAQSLDVPFDIPWVCLWSNPDNADERVAILGRICHWPKLDCPINTPLAVDLRTNKVSLLSERIPGLNRVTGAFAAVAVNGSLLLAEDTGVTGFIRQSDGTFAKQNLIATPQSHFLLPVGTDVYSPGPCWYRIELANGVRVVDLGERIFPPQNELNRFAMTGNFGLCAAWDAGPTIFQIDTTTPCKKVFSPFDRYVPNDQLERHLDAVEAIRGLKGHVSRTRYEGVRRDYSIGRSFPANQTIVCLTETWQGGDEGLRHLKDLHRLSILYLLKASVTDEGMKHIAKIEGLTDLYLAGTRVTTEGLKHLDLQRLKGLHLEGSPEGHAFNDDTLELLEGSNQLKGLCVCGPGFTERALESFKKMPALKKLRLLNTQIPAGAERLLQVPGRYIRQKGPNGETRVFDPGRYINVSTR